MTLPTTRRIAGPIAPVCVGLVLVSGVLAGGAGGQPVGSERIVWGQEVFAIPYRWSGATDPTRARRVELHLSRDAGASWRLVGTAEPRVQSFNYRATGDGDYWFAVRTIDNTGRSWPEGPLRPELHVAVDTQIPGIHSLAAALTPSGVITASCLVQDPHLDPASVRVQAQDQGDGRWRNLALRSTPSADGGTLQLRASGQLAPGTTRALVRVTAADQAGNPADAGTVAVLGAAVPASPAAAATPPAAAAGPFLAASQPLQPTSPYLPTPPDQRAGGASAPSGPRDPFLGQPPNFGPLPRGPVSGPPPGQTAGSSPTPNGSGSPPTGWRSPAGGAPAPRIGSDGSAPGPIAWAPDGHSRSPFRGGAEPLTAVPPPTPTLVARPTPSRGAPNPPHNVYRSDNPRTSFASVSGPPVGSPVGLPPGGVAEQPEPDRLANGPPSFRTAPLPEQARFIASRRFELDYDVAAAGRWGVEKVTLWGTRDRGKTWRAFAIDSDNRSPLEVSVDGEGLYGFRITVEGVGGLTPQGPRPGDAPELWVEVDQTEPRVYLNAAHQGEGYFGDHLVIHWQADDANLGPRPIALSYAARPNGPWAPMASSLENTGRYAWRLQRHLPGRLYLRVEAEDAAGNVGTAATPQPLAIDLPAPEATVRSVRPIGR